MILSKEFASFFAPLRLCAKRNPESAAGYTVGLSPGSVEAPESATRESILQVAKSELEPRTVSLDITVDAETVQKGFDRAYREFSNFTNVPGFRPGKAPRAMLARYVNHERLRERVMELIAGPAYREAVTQEEITPYTDPDVEFSDLAEGQPWQFKAAVPLPPTVELGDYKTVEVERPVYTVGDEEVDRQLEALREEYSKIQPVTGRGVQDGDVVIAELSVTPEGAEPAEPRRSLLRPGTGNNIPGFDDAIRGQMPEEERNFDLTYPEDFQEPDLAGKKATFRVTVSSINERILPVVNDEWAKQIGPFQTAEELRADIRQKLEQGYSDLTQRITESRIVEEIIKRSKIEFPSVMVQSEMEEEARDLGQDLQKRGISYESYLQQTGLTEEQHRQRMAATAVQRVRTYLVLREIARAENMSIPDEEIQAELDSLLEGAEVDEEEEDRIRASVATQNRIANRLLQTRLRDFLLSNAKIKDVPTKPNA